MEGVLIKTIETELGPIEIYVDRHRTKEEYDAARERIHRDLAKAVVDSLRRQGDDKQQ